MLVTCEKENFMNIMSFHWLSPLFISGYNRPLELDNVPNFVVLENLRYKANVILNIKRINYDYFFGIWLPLCMFMLVHIFFNSF
jgi:hypothetical protein